MGAPATPPPYPVLDVHTHLMPERLFQAVRAYFRAHLWQPRYEAPTEQLVAELLAAGVDRFVCMPYAHRGGMAQSLNYWIANVQATFAPHALAFGTFHPDDGDALPALAREAFEDLRLLGAKLHPQVGRFALDDPRLDPMYEAALAAGRVLLVHAGRKPEPSPFVGARAFRPLMRRFPDLKVIVAHMGGDEFDAFFDLCGEYEYLHLDTAMVFHQYVGRPPSLERILEYQDRVLFASDFPNIPYRVETAISAIRQLGLGRSIEERIFCTNAARLLGLDPAEMRSTSPAGEAF